VFSGDEKDGLEPDVETEKMWKELTTIDPDHISRWDRKDNFWEMGSSGPCGPCSEIHYDSTSEANGGHLVNQDDPLVIELWNLVFIQFNRGDDGVLSPLPNQHVDTGMGLERITRVLQGVSSNYDTDLWTPIFEAIKKQTGTVPYGGSLENPIDIAYRVIADHIRCLVVAIADGGRPGAAGRGYVLRRILRRGTRHAHQTLGVKGPMLCNLVPAVVQTLGETFPEIQKHAAHVGQIIREEEESFLKTLDRGLELFAKAAKEGDGKCIDAKNAFTLHDTFGFPIDLTEVMAEERNMTVDREGFESLMEAARETSRATTTVDQQMQLPPNVIGKLKTLHQHSTNDTAKYGTGMSGGEVVAIWNGNELVDRTVDGSTFGVILDRTSFYADAGGQVSDTGHIVGNQHLKHIQTRGISEESSSGGSRFIVKESHNCGPYVLHVGHILQGTLHCGDHVSTKIDAKRRGLIAANHSGTHLMNHALRTVLGDDVEQRGSLVDHDRLRFDFSHTQAMEDDQVREVEQLVNAAIDSDLSIDAAVVPLEKAMEIHGVRAVFGEQYPDPVRVVSIGATVDDLISDPTNDQWYKCSIEFCGGTHLANSKATGSFIIVHEQALASGTRRIIALTGVAAMAARVAGESLLQRISKAKHLEHDEFVEEYNELLQLVDELTISQTIRNAAKHALKNLRDRVKTYSKQAASSRRDSVLEQARQIAQIKGEVVIAIIEGADKDTMLTALDAVRSKRPDGAVMLFTADKKEQKVIIVAGVGSPLISRGLKAGDWVKVAATTCGGGGGGRPDTTQAGGRLPEKVPLAMQVAREYVKEVIQ
jgi:alanyl-tRNA synthetase